MKTDIIIVGCGCSGLYAALHLPKDKKILMISKDDLENSDSFLAQGGICVLKDESDYNSFFEDTMRAGHYENNPESVDIMIRSSKDTIGDLIDYGVDFQREEDGTLSFTKEGAHSGKRILFHEDITGKEITSKLLARVKALENVTIVTHKMMIDIVEQNNRCYGIVMCDEEGHTEVVYSDYTILACGGIGGLYKNSTNFKCLTGDALAIAMNHNIALENINYVQIHPTTFYIKDSKERSFLISESVRGEGALLYNKDGKRFVNELLPRDVVTKEIKKQMEKDGSECVWLDMSVIQKDELDNHFPNIVKYCREHGYDVHKERIPVVPAQHYFMGGIKVNMSSKTSADRLYAVGETACNGVHGKNRLASNSLLESLVFAKRAAKEIGEAYSVNGICPQVNTEKYKDIEKIKENYKKMIIEEIERLDNKNVRSDNDEIECRSVYYKCS